MDIYKRKSGGFIVVSNDIDNLVNINCHRIFRGDNNGVHSYKGYFIGLLKKWDGAFESRDTQYIPTIRETVKQCDYATANSDLDKRSISAWSCAWDDDRY